MCNVGYNISNIKKIKVIVGLKYCSVVEHLLAYLRSMFNSHEHQKLLFKKHYGKVLCNSWGKKKLSPYLHALFILVFFNWTHFKWKCFVCLSTSQRQVRYQKCYRSQYVTPVVVKESREEPLDKLICGTDFYMTSNNMGVWNIQVFSQSFYTMFDHC